MSECRPVPSRWPMSGRRTSLDDSGSVAVESVVVVPVAMMIVLLVVQVCLWAHAAALVQSAANTGELAATALGGSSTAGEIEAQTQLATTASKVVVHPTVHVQVLPGGIVEVTVSGETESILPWLRLPVSATRVGLIQEFRESG